MSGFPPRVPLSQRNTVISKQRPEGDPNLARPTKPQEVGSLLEGELLGHFLLERYIGGGGMGTVFRALDTKLGRTVAVKVLSTDTTDEETLLRFRNEAQSAARLDHPNIARVYYVGEDRGWDYIVFEYIEGDNVRDLVERNGPLSVEEAISYTLQVAEALAHASERDVVHRDIKPSNILVMPDGRVKLVDMGLARLHQVETSANDLTATGVTLGTFDYISPEQARDPRTADVRSDLYSLGCTFYFMLTGLPPFPEGTVLQKLLSHSSEQPPDLRDSRPELPPEVSAIARKLMSKQPSQRYQHPHELAAELLVLAERLGLPSPTPGGTVWVAAPEPWPARAARHLAWVLPFVLLVVAVCVLEWLRPIRPFTRADMLPRSAVKRLSVAPSPPKAEAPPGAADAVEPGAPQLPPAAAGVPGASQETKPLEKPPEPAADGGAAGPGREEPPGVLPSFADPEWETPPETERSSAATLVAPAGVTEVVPPSSQAGHDIETTNAGASDVRKRPPSDLANALPPTALQQTLVVKPSSVGRSEPNVEGSLAAAFRRLAETPGCTTIELQCNELLESPLALNLQDQGEELTVRAGKGYQPVIVFRPSAGYTPASRQMLRLAGGRVHFQGVNFRAELPRDPSNEWCLFSVDGASDVRLTHCTLTMRNPFQSSAAFFSVPGVQPNTPGQVAGKAGATKPKISLGSCVVRGQACLIRATEGLPFWLSWEQGFLATTEHLAEAGSLSEYSLDDVVRITLNHVTASMDRGLFRLEVRPHHPMVPEVGISCSNCVFVHPSSVPLIEHVGLETVAQAVSQFELQGKDNLYDFTEIRWRISPTREEPREFRWEEQDATWYREKRAERGLRWRAPLPIDREVSERTPNEYTLDASYLLEVADGQLAGCDLPQLPTPPAPKEAGGELP